MATRIEILLPARFASEAERVFAIFRRVDQHMSEWKESSPLSALNRAAGRHPVHVPANLRALIARGIDLGRRTDGAFDITWAALWGLWDFTATPVRLPEVQAIARRIALVDYRQIIIDERAGTIYLKRPGMKIGLGAIAKGYALDRSVEYLRRIGVRRFLLSAGGQVYAGGDRHGRPWRIGIRDPRGAAGDHFAVLRVRNASVSTSGDYERFIEVKGKRYHHILDPRTGRPSHGVRSATVIGKDATLADALSTALMVMGPERGLAVVERHRGFECVLVDDAGRLHTTPGAHALMRIQHAPRDQRGHNRSLRREFTRDARRPLHKTAAAWRGAHARTD